MSVQLRTFASLSLRSRDDSSGPSALACARSEKVGITKAIYEREIGDAGSGHTHQGQFDGCCCRQAQLECAYLFLGVCSVPCPHRAGPSHAHCAVARGSAGHLESTWKSVSCASANPVRWEPIRGAYPVTILVAERAPHRSSDASIRPPPSPEKPSSFKRTRTLWGYPRADGLDRPAVARDLQCGHP